MNTCSCLNLILACIVYWKACEISRGLSKCDPLANRIDLCCWNTSAQSNGTMSCSTANISSTGSLVRQRRRKHRRGSKSKGPRIDRDKSRHRTPRQSTLGDPFRATGITNYLENEGTLEVAQRIAGHADSRTTKLYDRRGQKVLLEDMERIRY